MNRRKVIAGLTLPFLTGTTGVKSQERLRQIFALFPGDGDASSTGGAVVLRQSLEQLGWVSGKNIEIKHCWSGEIAGMRVCADSAVRSRPDIIVSTSSPMLRAALEATKEVPIVFVAVSDPVGDGFVASLARPGGNATGLSSYEPTMAGKWLELLKYVVPNNAAVAVLFNPKTAPHSLYMPGLTAAAPTFDMKLSAAPVEDDVEIEQTVSALGREKGVSLLALPDSFTALRRKLIVDLAARHQVPAIYPLGEFVEAGGLMSYGVNQRDFYRRAPNYLDKILRGARPGDLPVEQPTSFRLALNLKTAKALGLTIPDTLLARADEVIE
jgi:putative tryptophan/tyrosine transport system substrate-binding protein